MSLRKKIAFQLTIKKITAESADASSITFAIPENLRENFSFKAGQFTSIFMDIEGEEVLRSYSLCTAPGRESEFKIMVKKIPGGKGSSFLVDRAQIGSALWCTPPAGGFFKDSNKDNHYLLIGAGSGITPLLSILKYVLSSKAKSRVTLVYCNRNQTGIIFGQELEQLEQTYQDRLKVIHVLSRPEPGWSGKTGRLDPAMLSSIYQSLDKNNQLPIESYLCGPLAFMEMIRNHLSNLSVSLEAIHIENFGVPAPLAPTVSESKEANEDNSQPREGLQSDGSLVVGLPLGEKSETPQKIIALIDGETVEIKAVKDQNILEALMNEGHNPPYSCMSGACMACMAKLEEGRIQQDDPGILTDDNIKHREILTCQAKPMSAVVKVRFDM